jgi:high frequency lysogenization protein
MSADSLQRPQLQTLTLSAVVQSAQLVRALAHTGSAPLPAMKALIDPLFSLNALSFNTIFPDLRLARPGLEWLTVRARQRRSVKNDEVLRYTRNLLWLRTKLMADTDMQSRLGRRLQSMSPLSAQYSDPQRQTSTEPVGLHETERSFEALATLYQDTISTLPFRIQVQGKVEHLQDERTANRIRALLLAGIRFAVLWHQIGGRPWHLFLLRGRINRIATSMLEN